MKLAKAISLYFIWPVLMLGLGFYAGVETSHFFYPGEGNQGYAAAPENISQKPGDSTAISDLETAKEPEIAQKSGAVQEDGTGYNGSLKEGNASGEETEEVMSAQETLCVDTLYVLEETDVLNHTVEENVGRLPSKYVGMDRDQFIQAMEVYADFPPLSEMERGFIGLNVLSFSRDRVVIQMNYKNVQPTSSFYLAVYDNEVVVYLDDRKTVYIETGIKLDTLPATLQQSIIDMMWIEDEEKLYNFLENYSS